ncbi:hypothetical protein QQM79_16740 [Marinobacteraceae bacterium S3BR75-40.1]
MVKNQYHIAAPVPEELAQRAAHLINCIRYEGPTKEQKEELYELIVELTEVGVDFFFLEPLRRLGAGPVMMKMANMGLNSTLKGTRMVIHKVLKRIDNKHLDGIVDFIEEILFEPEAYQKAA